MSRPTVEKSILHLVLAAYQAWGHVKPLCNLAARIVKSRPVTVTLVTARPFHERVDQELARSFEENENHFRRRIRVVAIMTNEQNPFDVQGFNASFSELYKKLADEEAVVCAKTGETLEQLNSPDAAILGIFGHALLLAVHEHSKRPVKVFTWYPGSVAAALFMFGPAGPNKGGDLSKEIEEETARSGKSIVEAAEEYFFGKHGIKGEIIRIPGLPPMYDYEFYPQDVCHMYQPGFGVDN
ncbi:hypothetical protein EW026_g4483 [Hermanssonia centrifuga]|uniref:Uncharacterized protein n=1 Tax=Hermanssonia centrifuga TaxID=98765 RepID=A0A4S4KH04_9APHY|nr:hypothetical protein EW026_g4483 [Hermanssonia centrifuga]